ncbi:glucose-6-phosphate isomerase [Prochlorococcus marinus]|uniref:glucose-6-phosphate isomerase n=1 Tax=Prochlorococcus marinus TaxID=1219 RepID=UPI0022B38953|nr:glucose-6-phosphate isomerase [Prochlorococcus marinus]
MNFPDFSSDNANLQWKRFSNLLYFNDELGLWLDISRMKITSSNIESLSTPFNKAFDAIDKLEKGAISNADENRQVGHYWLRDSLLAPTKEISNLVTEGISDIAEFGRNILSGKIKNEDNKPFTDVCWIGIGGSGLGPILIINALKKSTKGLNFIFIDNVDTNGINDKLVSLKNNLKTTLFVVVSKSGGTPEPQIAMDQAKHFLLRNNIEWSKRSIAITMKDSLLDKIAKSESWLKRFDLPDWVGGRTSITGSVGLLPLALIDENIYDFLKGASTMDSITREKNIYQNPSALLASAWYYSGDGKGLRDMVVLPYQDRLEVFSKYLQQLIMESLGKQEDRSGNIVNQGLSVYGNKGSTDQHAYVQQLRDGIDNFFVTFIEILQDNKDIPTLNDKSPGDYLSGFLQGTRLALSENGRQSITISLRKFNAFSLGALIALFERSVGLYAELIDINAYHQPGVEAGKKAASNLISLKLQIENILSDKKPYSINDIVSKLNHSSCESVFLIIRHISVNQDFYTINGDWSEPSSLIIKRTN